jgi:squalene-hopene/tetraprenyl-beta-curcumene cyclase
MSPSLQVADQLTTACAEAIRRAVTYMMSLQKPEGYWWGDLTADTTLESDFILLELWKHPPEGGVWNPPTRPLIDKAVESILARQLPDGGFNIYSEGPSELSATIKAYTSLKLAGLKYDDPRLASARERILAMGGLQSANSYVKVNLSLFGLYPRKHTPSIPPEIMLLGNFIYQMSSWTRAIVIPLSIVHALNPQRPVPAGFTLQELLVPGAGYEFPNNEGFFSWRNFFLKADRLLKFMEKRMWRGVRTKAIKRAEEWMLERTRYSDGVAAIYPPMMYVIMALDLLGYPKDHPDVREANQQFMNLLVDDKRGFFFQPCFSVVWDTAIAAYALGESGIAPEQAMTRCADWLLTKEVRRKGDWTVKRPNVAPSGWYFEFANEFYPDIDDTAQVLLALAHSRASTRLNGGHDACVKRATEWLIAMQSSDGGWAAFDVDNNWNMLSAVPFADHNAMLDPTCPDITGRVLEALMASGVDRKHPAIRKGVAYLKRSQETDGSWYGRWGVDYIYGTFLALRGLQAAGESDREALILRAGEWLRAIQNADGGWGESCESYDRNTFVPAPSTPSQTAWAILGLLAGGDTTSDSLQHGIEYLIDTQRGPVDTQRGSAESQRNGGGWDESLSTGTGFPRVFYLKYHLYRDSFPVLALSTYLKTKGAQ